MSWERASSYYESSSCSSSEAEEWVWCKYCPNQMPVSAMQGHIYRKHMTQCEYCNNKMPESSISGHLWRKHFVQIGNIEISDDDFTELMEEKKMFAKSGVVYGIEP